jgi:hypothetical protein
MSVPSFIMSDSMESKLREHIRAAAAPVDPSAPSVSKWWPVRDLLAEAMGLPPDEIYVATVSKPGNLKVRSEQSQRGTGAKVLGGMYTGRTDQLEQCLRSAKARCLERNLMILIFVDEGRGFDMIAVVKQTSMRMPSMLASTYPTASMLEC